MAKGDYDQVVPATTRDELGELALAFNTMARKIREFQQAGTAKLVRAQQTAQATIDSFPDPVVVVDLDGAVERANPAARRILGVTQTNGAIPWTAPALLRPALGEVLGGRPDHLPTGLDHTLCLRDEGQERYFLPRVLAIRGEDGLLGAAVVLQDVTKFRLVDQLKSDMVSTVSHELKTPLTSVQMAIHLLLEEAVGPLTAKQVELLLAARQDSERLLAMVNNLLDLTRIEQGQVRLELVEVASADLVSEALHRFETGARAAGIELKADVAFGLPPVRVDRERIGHVFDNLISNALAHTDRGGAIQLSAEVEGESAAGGAGSRPWPTPARASPPSTCRASSRSSTGCPGRGRRGGRAGPGHRPRDRRGARRPDRSGQPPRRGATFTFRLPIAPDRDGPNHRGGAT